ncbi:MAG TPA: porin [Ramlibacter sp.]|nr:porin [Ramlibacter sp.]
MKKYFLLSAIGLACAAAQAQSSVTMYGVVDVNLQRFDAGGVGKSTMVGNGGLSTSRIGLRGVEDLGGGLNAGFWLEGSINPDTGEGRASNSFNQPITGIAQPAGREAFKFDRVSYASLAGGWGEVRLGHDFIPTHWSSIFFDPFNANGVARAGNLTFAGVLAAALPTAITGSNAVEYWLPNNIGGIYGMAMAGAGENVSGTPNSQDGNFGGARIGYATGPFDVAVAMTRTHNSPTAAIGNYTHANIGGTWNAGPVRLFALYNVVKVDLTGGEVRKNTAELGAIIPVGVGLIRMSYAVLDDRSDGALHNANGSARSSNDAHQWGLGYVYNLSKRSALYGTYASLSNSGQANYTVSGNRAPLPGQASSGLELGVRHTF